MQARRNEARGGGLGLLLRRAPLILCILLLGVGYALFAILSPGKDQPADAKNPSGTVTEPNLASISPPVPSTSAPTEQPPVTTAAVTDAPVSTTQTEPPVTTTEAPPATTEAPEPEGRVIYLTFDDGPGKNTREVLDILDQYGVKATFFTVGYYVDRFPETAKEIVDRGQYIACHSYTHEYEECYASVDAFMNELEKWKQAVQNATGSLPERISVRFPGGSSTGYAKNVAAGIKDRLLANGMRWFDWNAADNDKYPKGNTKGLSDADYFWESYQETIGWYVNRPEAQVVFLTHDSERGTVDILGRMIQDLLDRGYTFKTLDQHPDWN